MEFACLNHQSQSYILLINVKMPTIVGILTFMSRINIVLSRVEQEKSCITSGPSVAAQAGLCLKWVETPETGFLALRLTFDIAV